METLTLDLDHALRSFRLALALDVGRETVALVGPSGAGKTTVLRAIAGLVRPDRGVVSLGRETWLDTAAGVEVPPERRRVGLVFQEYALFPHLSVRDNVAFGARDDHTVAALLERFRIGHLAGARPRELSGGERQRVALARATVMGPRILLADEPTGNLDDRASAGVFSLFREINAVGTSILMATHDSELIRRHADIRVIELETGRLVFDSDGEAA